jgi:diguanylate cyclase (GGDEF)-like protein
MGGAEDVMIDPALWSNLLDSGMHHMAATPRHAADPDEVLPAALHPHDRAAAVAVLGVAAVDAGFRTVLVGRVLDDDRRTHVRIEIVSDALNLVVTVTPDQPLDDEPDPVTGLPGHAILLDRIDQALLGAGRTGRMVGVVRVDLEGVRRQRTARGVTAADDLLRRAAAALERAVRPADTVTRVGPDDFVIVTPELRNAADVAVVAERVLAALADDSDPGASLGIGIGDPTVTADRLLADAAEALERVRQHGGGRWLVAGYDAEQGLEPALDQLLRTALDDRTLDAWYQPVVDQDGRVTSVEALVALLDPHGDRRSADAVLEAAAHAGLQMRLDHRVIDRAVAQLAAWDRAGLLFDVAVNVATSTATRLDLAGVAAAVLAREGLTPARLHLELAADDLAFDGVTDCIQRLRAIGVTVVADRWNGGEAAVEEAIASGVHAVKLDRTVIAGHTGMPATSLRSRIARLREAGIPVTAVGVELDAHRALAVALGCASIQGFLTGRPVPASQVPALLAAP